MPTLFVVTALFSCLITGCSSDYDKTDPDALDGKAAIAPSSTDSNSVSSGVAGLRNVEPSISWDSTSIVTGDFNGDGVADVALAGTKPDSAFLGIVAGASTSSKHWILRFPVDAGSQGGVCEGGLELSRESLVRSDDKELVSELGFAEIAARLDRLPTETHGLRFGSGGCDKFHVYWDPAIPDFDWWRP